MESAHLQRESGRFAHGSGLLTVLHPRDYDSDLVEAAIIKDTNGQTEQFDIKSDIGEKRRCR